jgi:hypothetical protein
LIPTGCLVSRVHNPFGSGGIFAAKKSVLAGEMAGSSLSGYEGGTMISRDRSRTKQEPVVAPYVEADHSWCNKWLSNSGCKEGKESCARAQFERFEGWWSREGRCETSRESSKLLRSGSGCSTSYPLGDS